MMTCHSRRMFRCWLGGTPFIVFTPERDSGTQWGGDVYPLAVSASLSRDNRTAPKLYGITLRPL